MTVDASRPPPRFVRQLGVLAELASLSGRARLSYGAWFWASAFTQGLTLVVAAAFWRAVYAGRDDIVGLNVEQAVSYVVLARLFVGLADPGLLGHLGRLVRSGDLGTELLRPVDLQLSSSMQGLGIMAVDVLSKLPIMLPLALLLGVRLPADPQVYLGVAAVVALGLLNIFLFEWALACVSFYTSYVWGLTMLRGGIVEFLSGALLPLAFMPEGLRAVALALPHAQVVALPAALLSGQTGLSGLPRVLLGQLLLAGVLWPLSRFVFSRAIRAANAQGG